MTATLVVLRTEALTGSIRLIGQISMVVMIGLCTFAPIDFQPGWADPLNYGLTASSFLIPIGAGSAALRVVQLVRSGSLTIAATSPRAAGAALQLSALAVCGWQVTSFLMGLSLVLLRANLDGPLTPAMLLLPILALGLIVAAVFLGAVLGRFWQSNLTAPLAVAVVFGVVYFTPYVGGAYTKFAVIYSTIFYQPFFEPNVPLITGQLFCALGLVAFAQIVISFRHRVITGALAAILLVCGVGSAARAGSGPVQYIAQPSPPACASSAGTQLCVWPYYRQALPQTLEALVAARKAAQPFMTTPSLYAQEGLRTANRSRVIYLPAAKINDVQAINSALPAVLPDLCANGAALEESSQLSAFLAVKMSIKPDFVPESVASILKQPVQQQHAWFAANLARTRLCRA